MISYPLVKYSKFYKKLLPDGELNPGLPRDRRGYSPLYYRGLDVKRVWKQKYKKTALYINMIYWSHNLRSLRIFSWTLHFSLFFFLSADNYLFIWVQQITNKQTL